MARCRRSTWWGKLSGLLLFGVVTVLPHGRALATIRYEALEISGNLETQNIIRHSSIDKIGFVQNRNTLQIRLDWDWLDKGVWINKFDVPFIKRSKFYLLYRGVYDGFYDLEPGGNQIGQSRFDDLIGGPIEGNRIGTCRDRVTGALLSGEDCVPGSVLREGAYSRFTRSDRSSIKRENLLREVYVDVNLADYPVSMRIGRQQVIWGESDQFRIMDIWNPLDVTWHFQQESWDRIRVPLWLFKGLWDVGRLGPLSNTFLEVVYNPFDYQPGTKVSFLPRPWALPIPDPVRIGQIQIARDDLPFRTPFVSPVFGDTPFENDFNGTSLRKGDFQRNPEEASEIGARLHAVTPQGVEFAIAYLYGRGKLLGAAKPFGLRINSITLPGTDPTGLAGVPPIGEFNGSGVIPAFVDAEFVHPYMHIFGMTGNYFEGDFTSAVLRWETAYGMDLPFQTIDKRKRVGIKNALGNQVFLGFDEEGNPAPALSPLGFDKRDVWTGMVGFDRPTWIRWLNSKSTFFITGQFFWSYTLGDTDVLRESTFSAGDSPYFTPPLTLPTGQRHPFAELNATSGVGTWTSGPLTGQVERVQNAAFDGNADKVQQWEMLTTLAAFSFYRGGTLMPFVAAAWDPVNQSLEVLYDIDFFYTNDFIIRFSQKYFSTLGRSELSNDPWFAGGRFHRRDETIIRLTYQF